MTDYSRSFYLRNALEKHQTLALVDPGRPKHLERSLKDIKSLCNGYLGTHKTIQMFFRILVASGVDKHSIFREKFWKSYLQAGFIDQAWLVLAPVAEKIAREQLGLKSHQYACLRKNRRIDERHAVLLMRLDQIIVAEWSHLGKCRFWFSNNLHRPSLHQASFSREELIDHSDYIQQHYFSSKGLWQKDAAAWMSARGQIPSFY